MELADNVFDRARVEGRILARGEPLSQAVFSIRLFQAGCHGDPILILTQLMPDSDGTFRENLFIVDPETDDALVGCIEIVVTPLSGVGVETTTVIIDEVQFVRSRPIDGPVDIPTVEIEINVDDAEALNP